MGKSNDEKCELYALQYAIPQYSSCKIGKKSKADDIGVQGIYSYIDHDSSLEFDDNSKLHVDVNSLENINLSMQVVLYLLQTTAEILISVVGLDYVYSEAPVKLKSVLSSLWLLTVSVGNIPAIFLNNISLFPGLNTHDIKKLNVFFWIVIVTIPIYLLVAFKYDPVKRTSSSDENEKQTKKSGIVVLACATSSNIDKTDLDKTTNL